MASLADIEKLNAASDLVRAGLRLSIIVALTGMTVVPLRRLWKETHGKSPPNGKLPESVLSFITTQQSAAQISAFVGMYHKLNPEQQSISSSALLNTWRTYERMCAPLDINAGYYAVRDVRAGLVSFFKCRCCGAHYIYDTASTLTSRCQFCGNVPIKDK